MVARRSRSILGLVQVGLLVLTVATGILFAAWMLGYNGLGLISGSDLPAQLQTSDSNAAPSEMVLVQGKEGIATIAAANRVTGGVAGHTVQPGDGSSEFYGNPAYLSFDGPTEAQHVSWLAVRALPVLGLAVIWWLLFRIVRDVRRGAGFTRIVARRMLIIGVLVLIGLPAVELARWKVANWLVESSTAARMADAAPLHLDVWPFAVGMVVLVLAWSWRDATAMREDLEGLV